MVKVVCTLDQHVFGVTFIFFEKNAPFFHLSLVVVNLV